VALYWAARIAWPGGQVSVPTTDLFVYFYPTYAAAYGWVAAHRLPLWNPYLLCGVPWFATLQPGFLYLSHVLYLLTPPYVGLAASALLHLLLVALSTAIFVRRLGTTAGAAGLAAVLFTIRGSIRHWVLWPNLLEAAAWLPVGGIAILSLVRRPGGIAASVLAGAAAMSLLAGYPQVTAIVVYGWMAFLLALLVSAGASPRRWAGAGAAVVGALVVGVLVAAVQLVPALELASVGVRQLHALTLREMYTFGGGLPQHYDLSLFAPGSQMSLGLFGMSLVPAALLSRAHRRLAIGMLTIGLIAFAFALGPVTPLFAVYSHLPLFGWFRNPERILLLTDFCFAVTAAIAFDVIIGTRAAADRGPETGIVDSTSRRGAMLALATLVAVGAFTTQLPGPSPRRVVALLLQFGLAFLLLACTLRLNPARARAVAGMLIAAGTLELFAAAQMSPMLPLPYTPAAETALHRYEAPLQTLRAAAGTERVWLYGGGVPRLELAPTLATLMELHAVDGYVPTNLRRQAEYFTYFTEGSTRLSRRPWLFQGRIEQLWTPWYVASPAARRRLIDLASVRFLVVPASVMRERGVSDFVDAAGFEARPFGSDLRLWENPAALPRAFVVYRLRTAPAADVLLGLISRSDFDPLVESYVEGDPLLTDEAVTPPRGQPARIVRDEDALVEVEADLAAPGLVVLGDTFYAGWRATVDGTPVPILATNHLFRGVRVDPGRHRVSFRYQPASMMLGVAGTLLGGLALAVVAALGLRRGRER
jgi:hypothetical protein